MVVELVTPDSTSVLMAVVEQERYPLVGTQRRVRMVQQEVSAV